MKRAEAYNHTEAEIKYYMQIIATYNWKCECIKCTKTRQIQLDAWQQGVNDATVDIISLVKSSTIAIPEQLK